MADQKTNAGVTGDDIQKAKDYADAMDKLKASISGVNTTLPQFSEGLQAGLKAIGEKLPDVVTAMGKLNEENKKLAENGEKPKSVISQLGSALFSWNNALSIGITLITTYGPKVLSFLANLFDSDKARAAAQALKDYKDVMDKYTQSVSMQSGELQTLLSVAKNHNIAEGTRIEAIRKLNSLGPEYLKGLTLANINTKEGTTAINEYVKALKRKAIEEATQSKMTDLVKQRMEITDGYQAAKKEVEKYRAEKVKEPALKWNNFRGEYSESDAAKAEKNYQDYVEKDKDIIKRMHNLDDLLQQQLTSLAPQAQLVPTLSGKAYWDKILEDKQQQLATLDAGAQDFEAKSQPIIASIKQTQKILSGYDIKPDVPKSGNNQGSNDAEEAQHELTSSIARSAEIKLQGYAHEIQAANDHFDELKEKFSKNKKTLEQLEKERVATLADISKKFRNDDLEKLNQYQADLQKIARDAGKTAQQLAVQQVEDDYNAKAAEVEKTQQQARERQTSIQGQISDLKNRGKIQEAKDLEVALNNEIRIIVKADEVKLALTKKYNTDVTKLNDDFNKKQLDADAEKASKAEKDKENEKSKEINKSETGGHHSLALKQQAELLDLQHDAAVAAAKKQGKDTADIDAEYAKKRAGLEDQLTASRIHAGDRYIDAVLKNTKKDSAIYKAAFLAKKATSIADVIISTKKGIIGSFEAYAGMPFIGQALAIAQAALIAGQGAASIAEITKQKPGFATGGQYISDGRGAVLPGYSRTDNTNAQLRSGEAVVVSEAMRDPWARNLVSAINVAYGGRDFSIPSPGRGYAVGGIFTDGGNASRYYSQPANDVKDLANTIAYQMINNFPPVYVDVKDINTQQNILAQTINRVNL